VASLAIVGAGIAVALQNVVKDVVGWMIVVQRRLFTLGDRVSIGPNTGDVIDIGLLRTTMLEVSVAGLFNAHERTGKTLYVPNSLILSEPLLNYNTTSDFMSVEMKVTVSYESDWKKAESILKEVLMAETAEYAEQARRQQRKRTALFYTAWEVSEPEVHVDLDSSGILFTLKFTVPIGKRRSTVTSLSRSILEHFGAQYDVNIAFNTIRIVGGETSGEASPLKPA
jgi:small-conductance mechanosensitive channel